MTGRHTITVLAAMLAFAVAAAPASAFNPTLETKNFAKILEREHQITATPEFQARLAKANVDNNLESLTILASDPDRVFGNICGTRTNECAGDVRFYDWGTSGLGVAKPVVFTARDGATLSGTVWASATGPATRPAVVITTGSVQAPETLYWGTAATLAKHGYVVLTYDVQGQSRSDVLGEAPDGQEGVPSQAGQPFYDGTEDALDFLLSTPANPYVPRLSCGNANGGVGTSHAAKQNSRVAAGFDAAYNPLHGLVDSSRIGIAGHSLGAAAVSYIGQTDPRVDAITAYDNLSAPGVGMFGAPACPSTPASRPASPPITKPALGISNDYSIYQSPYTSDPDPQSHNAGFLAFKDAGVDSIQVNIRGGTHEESAFIPGNTTGPTPLGAASLRGNDMVAWYTTAWFDKQVKCPGLANAAACEADADKRLMTNRWRDDAPAKAVDLNSDGNDYSFYLRSRFDFKDASNAEQICDDLRAGCQDMGPDGNLATYSIVSDAYSPPPAEPGDPAPDPPDTTPCALPQAGSAGTDTVATLPPSDAGDAIRGRGGNDRLSGGAGDDCIYGQKGNDRLHGNAGNDKVSGGSGQDRVYGDAGNDRVRGGRQRDRIFGGAGRDTVSGGGRSDRISGGPGRDRLLGGQGNDRINARDGSRDFVNCGPGRHDRARIDSRDRTRGCEHVRRANH